MSVRREVQRERRQKLTLDLKRLRKPDWRQLGVRFAFGALIALVAGIAGERFGPRLGGAFLAFPAILPAALTLLERASGLEETDVDAVGASLGAVALLCFALALALLGSRAGPVVPIIAAGAVWVAVAVALFFLGRGLAAVLTRRRS